MRTAVLKLALETLDFLLLFLYLDLQAFDLRRGRKEVVVLTLAAACALTQKAQRGEIADVDIKDELPRITHPLAAGPGLPLLPPAER